MPTDADTAIGEQTALQHDMHCVSCDYNLRGLPPGGACPECGAPIARTLAAPTHRGVNHRWLARMQIALWLLLAVSLLSGFWGLLSFVGNWYLPYTPLLVYWEDFYPQSLIGMLHFVAIWMLTMPEPGPQRCDSPRVLAAWARWLCVAHHAIPILQSCMSPPTLGSAMSLPGILISQTATSAGAAAMICLLLMLRRYALRSVETRIAFRLALAAAIGCGVALLSIATAVLFILSPDWFWRGGWFLQAMALAGLGYTAILIWATVGFALRVRQASLRQRPTVRLGRTLSMIAGALLFGAAVGWVAGQVLYIQAGRAISPEAARAIYSVSWWTWQVGLVVGVALLPPRLAVFCRKWARSR